MNSSIKCLVASVCLLAVSQAQAYKFTVINNTSTDLPVKYQMAGLFEPIEQPGVAKAGDDKGLVINIQDRKVLFCLQTLWVGNAIPTMLSATPQQLNDIKALKNDPRALGQYLRDYGIYGNIINDLSFCGDRKFEIFRDTNPRPIAIVEGR